MTYNRLFQIVASSPVASCRRWIYAVRDGCEEQNLHDSRFLARHLKAHDSIAYEFGTRDANVQCSRNDAKCLVAVTATNEPLSAVGPVNGAGIPVLGLRFPTIFS